MTCPETYVGLIRALDGLYRDVVADPSAWGDEAFSDWARDVLGAGVQDRGVARAVRRGLRQAGKLRKSLMEERGPAAAASDDWRSVVDQVLGSPGWAPTLELAQLGLAAAPTEELFEEVRERFRVVNFQPWMEGITFTDWVDDRRGD